MGELLDAGLEVLARPGSLAERVHHELRERIATGALVPGQRLTERGIASLLGVSPTPVREAVRRLEQEGLISRSSTRWMTVVEHSEQSLYELLYAEAVLRSALARFAATKISDANIDQMAAIVDELEATSPHASATETLAKAQAFDAILEDAADNTALESLVASTGIVGRSRRVHAVTAMRDRIPHVGLAHLKAHRDIVDALRRRDADDVERLVRAQLLASLDLLLSNLDGD